MPQRPQQLPDGAADEGVCIPRSRGPEDVGAVQKLGGVFGDEASPPRRLHQPLEQVPLKPPLEQLAAKVAQHGSVEAPVLEPETEGVFPSEVETHPLLGLGVGAVVVVLQEHGEDDHRGRYGRAAPRRILVERSVVSVVNEDIPPFGEPGIE